MARHRLFRTTQCRHEARIEQLYLASLLAIIGLFVPAVVDAVGKETESPQACFREAVPWLPESLLPAGETVAFEEHAHFIYLAVRPAASPRPAGPAAAEQSRVRLVFLRPSVLVTFDESE